MYENRVVLITGASRGIGRHLCEYFLSRHARVIGVSRSSSSLSHESYRHFSLDVSSEESVQELFCVIRAKYGLVDILINNAGALSSQYAVLMSGGCAESMMKTNFMGTFLMSRECAKLMLRRRFGRIINISSMAVPLSSVGSAIYSASKSAVTQFSRVFAKEVGDYNITCNVLGITVVETEMMKKIPREKLDGLIRSLPIKRFASMADITNVIDFFAKKESGAITGQILYLGGAF